MTTFFTTLLQWVDSSKQQKLTDKEKEQIDWLRVIPFILLHLACLGVFFVGYSTTAICVAVAFYCLRVFSITAFYHRYFSHKTYTLNRFWQFIAAILGETAIQRGPIWWAAHHRHHHIHSDQEQDHHSCIRHGFLKSHMGWFLTKGNFNYDSKKVQDWLKFPELVFLDRFDVVVPILTAFLLFFVGHLLYIFLPQLNTSGMQLLIWGFFISSVVSLHVTFSINSLTHIFGRRTYPTKDNSKNSWPLAILTFGEGWHNNHHYYPATAQQGFKWWQLDITFYILVLLEKIGIISNLKRVPRHVVQGMRK